jgi:small subunit ribosomal protein S1
MENPNAHSGQEVEPSKDQPSEVQPLEQATPSMQSLLDQPGLTLELPSQGEIRKGIIATIRENEILVSIGTKSEGVISGREFEQIPDEERIDFHVGQEIPVFILDVEDSNGTVVLSYLRAREEKDWEEVEHLLETNEVYSSKIIGYNKGGVIVPIGNLRGFVPASQISLLRRPGAGNESPDQRYGKLVGEEMEVRVIEVDRSRRRLILSERQALQETRETLKDRLLDELKEGDIRKGRVTSLADFGAFVNIDGADGLVHLSEISWERIQHPNEFLKVGQEVEVKVISVDRERKRIGLSLRQLQRDPWMDKIGHLKEGMLVEGTITHLTKFGAFARIGEDLEGLIHVSELSESRINHPKEVVKEGDVLTLRVIKIEPERRRIGLSLRKVDSPAYADLDWKMALSEEVGKVQEEGAHEEAAPEGVPAEQQPAAEQPAEEVPPSDQPVDESPPESNSAEGPVAGEEPSVEDAPTEAPMDEGLAEASSAEGPAAEEEPPVKDDASDPPMDDSQPDDPILGEKEKSESMS